MRTTPCQWWNQFNIFIYILSLAIIFFFKTVGFESNDHWLCIGSGQFVYISFQFFFRYSSLFQFVNDGFCQVLHIFFSFFTPDTMRHGLREYASKSSAFSSKRLLTVSVTSNLPSKNIMCSSSVSTFFTNFSISSFCFFSFSSKFVWWSSSDIAGSVISRFLLLGRGCQCAVVWAGAFVGVAVGLDLLFLFPETLFLFQSWLMLIIMSCNA